MTLTELLAQPGPIVADGAWGTELASRGVSGAIPDAANLDNPEAVAEVAGAYAEARAHLVLTNSFGASPIKLEKAGVSACEAINRAAVMLSRQGVAGKALVIADMGPTGELVGLTSKLTAQDLEDAFETQAAALAAAKPDGFVIETLSDLTEAEAAYRAVRTVSTLPVVVSFSYDEGARGPATMMGVRPADAARALADWGVDMVGANCGRLSDDAWRGLVETLAEATEVPVWAKANAGIPQLVSGKAVFPMDPASFAALGKSLVDAGARVVGGCCGSSPAHIAALADALLV